jgi:hypothetical protein
MKAFGLFKTEVIRRRGPWRSLEAVECAVLAWVYRLNGRRLLEPIGYVGGRGARLPETPSPGRCH